ncbi:MAG TPA: carboxypeptidase-like regulatory domain-containing protein [Limnochordales bacterium]
MSHAEPPGRIHGRVKTPDGRPVPGASIRIVDDGIVVDLQKTNQQGEFTSRLLFAGRYRIEVIADGTRGALDGVEVVLGRTTTVEVLVSE